MYTAICRERQRGLRSRCSLHGNIAGPFFERPSILLGVRIPQHLFHASCAQHKPCRQPICIKLCLNSSIRIWCVPALSPGYSLEVPWPPIDAQARCSPLIETLILQCFVYKTTAEIKSTLATENTVACNFMCHGTKALNVPLTRHGLECEYIQIHFHIHAHAATNTP
jgi:hypothetical protein